MSTDELIREIESYAAERDLSPATVVSRAVSNGRLFGRLKAGYGCTLKTAERIRDYIRSNSTASVPSTSSPTLNSEQSHDPAPSDAA